ncbi:MAG: hypothetical protein V7647_2738 [Acidobacteriota bacterium]|jgi:hypothetical protein
MAIADHMHSPRPEEIMEYLDGEGTVHARAAMESHITQCAACRVVVAEQRRLADDIRAWRVPRAPASLHAPPPRRRFPGLAWGSWRPSRLATAALGAAAATLLIVGLNGPIGRPVNPRGGERAAMEQPRATWAAQLPPARSAPPRDFATANRRAELALVPPGTIDPGAVRDGASEPLVRTPAIVRTATLRLVAKDLGSIRGAVERIVGEAGGFADYMTAVAETGSPRTLRATLRVPSTHLADTLDRLRQLGQVVEDTQQSEDVTDQQVDLDVRLASARTTESRLTDLLRNRTARLSDILDVERELARVRLQIERMDAERTNLGRRVSYATVTLEVVEERKPGLVPGQLSLASRFRVAAAEGLDLAMESVFWTILALMRAGPAAALWLLVFISAALVIRRSWHARRRRSQ